MAKTNIRQQLNVQIIASLEQGTLPWRCPWDRTQTLNIPFNLCRNEDYHGFNVLHLWCSQIKQRYSTAHWLSYGQARKMGGQVRKDEHGTPVVFYKAFEKEPDEVDDNGEAVTEQIRMLRHTAAFNLDQIDGIEAPDPRARFGFEPVDAAERILNASSITILHGGARACYQPNSDIITMPDRDRFDSAADYYATALHELTHATKHRSRCDRPTYETSVHKGSYAFEELVAELGSLYCMSALGLHGEIAGHASYIDHWLS
jgi:antirestriction protein ArdC